MKNIIKNKKILFLSLIAILIISTIAIIKIQNSKNKIFGIIELGETTVENLPFKYKIKEFKSLDNPFEVDYIECYTEYAINETEGILKFGFSGNSVITWLTFETEDTNNYDKLKDYLCETYGFKYKSIEEDEKFILRWTSNNITIDYELTDKLQIHWYY